MPKDLTQPTTTGAIISVICVLFISFMLLNDVLAFMSVDMCVSADSHVADRHERDTRDLQA